MVCGQAELRDGASAWLEHGTRAEVGSAWLLFPGLQCQLLEVVLLRHFHLGAAAKSHHCPAGCSLSTAHPHTVPSVTL